jgi:hypothetical protein
LRKGGIPPAGVKIGGNGKFAASNFWMGFVGATDGGNAGTDGAGTIVFSRFGNGIVLQ